MTEKSAKSSGILGGIAQLAGASGLAQFIQVGCSPIITRLYGTEQFGIFSVFLSISGTLIAISCMRYESAVMLPENHSEASGVFWLCVVLLKAMLAVIVAVGASLWTSNHLGVLGNLGVGLWLIPVVVASGGLLMILNLWANRVRAYSALARTKVVAVVIFCCGSMAMGWGAKPMAIWLVSAYAAGQAGALGLLLRSLRRVQSLPEPQGGSPLLPLARRFGGYPKFSLPMTLIDQATSSLPILLLATHFGAASAGMFGVAVQVLRLPSMLVGQAVAQITFERAARLKDDQVELKGLLHRMILVLFAVGLIPVIILVPFGPRLFAWVFGAGFMQAGQMAAILSVASCLSLAVAPLGMLPSIYDRLRGHFLFTLGGVLLRVTSMYLGIWMGSWYYSLILMVGAEAIASLTFAVWSYHLIGAKHEK